MAQQRQNFSEFVEKSIIPQLRLTGDVEVVLLTCMDFRYPQRIIDTMEDEGLKANMTT